ncbi:DDE-type integrase/transposase/recombinase [Crassaminicella indica]|uniref:DDE-type integrase/transposase/recombinase n=1 Tax=Crassaminicella indica TaxID=2855394 RepID=UPI003B8334F3
MNQKWVTDITYIYTIKDSWCYLASIMDLYTRKIIGYSRINPLLLDTILNFLKIT